MGPIRFDLLTRALTQRTICMPSRRSLLHLLGGGLLGGGLARPPDAEARRRKGNGKGNKKKKCKGGKRKCDGRCVDLQTDGRNCGDCGEVCGSDELCQDGACVDNGPCPVNQARCDGQCVDIYTEPTNCGGCGNNCAADEICLLGDCCRPHGKICVSHGQCCSQVCASVDDVKPGGQVCHLPGIAGRCCVASLNECSASCDCCGSLLCVDRRCCYDAGEQCVGNSQCCGRRCGPDGFGPTCL